mmetsp:Transcript_40021/g.64181  ORF Transcript_40021/g.64181 Transcript_40021/m.64181 type:complete len:166 (-) Transcript_40021:80-577(-)|eukprot:jgi/Bigna1/128352/aug1.6_g3060
MGSCCSDQPGPTVNDKNNAEQHDEPEQVKKEYRLTSKQRKLVDEFYERFDKDRDGKIGVESIAKFNTSPREEITKLLGMAKSSVGKMEKDGMVDVFEQANATFGAEAGSKNGIAFVTDMLTVLLRVTKGDLSEEEGNKYLNGKALDYGIANAPLTPMGSSINNNA